MAELILPKPVNALIEGTQAGQQNRLNDQSIQGAGQQSRRRDQVFSQAAETASQNRTKFALTTKRLKQINEEGGLKNTQLKLKKEASLLNAVLQLPESQQANGYEAIKARLEPETREMFSGGFDPQRASVIRDTALSSDKSAGFLYGKTIQGTNEQGKPVFIQIAKDGSMKEVKGFKPPRKKGISLTTAAGDKIQIGGDGQDVRQSLAKPVVRKQQEVVINAQTTLANLSRIRALADPEFFTYFGQIREKAGSVMEKLGIDRSPEGKERARRFRLLNNEVEQEFNAYRKEITGAAAAIAELSMLRKSFINMDLDFTGFQAAFDQYEAKKLRALRLSRRVLREGVQVGTKDYTKRMDALWVSAGDDDTETRGDELLGSGLSEQEVLQQLQTEGYQ